MISQRIFHSYGEDPYSSVTVTCDGITRLVIRATRSRVDIPCKTQVVANLHYWDEEEFKTDLANQGWEVGESTHYCPRHARKE